MAMVRSCMALALAVGLAGCGDKDKFDYRASGDLEGMPVDKSQFEVVKDPPYTVQTRFAAGLFADSEGRYLQAIEQFEEALKLDAKHEPSLYHLAVAYTRVKRFDNAADTWKRFIKVTKQPAVGYSNLGFTCELAGWNDQAEAAYKKGIEIDPKSEAVRVKYGLMLARHDELDEAIKQWEVVLTPAQIQYNIGSVYEARGRTALAKQAYEEALALKPDFSDAQQRLDRLNGRARLPAASSVPQSNTPVAVPGN